MFWHEMPHFFSRHEVDDEEEIYYQHFAEDDDEEIYDIIIPRPSRVRETGDLRGILGGEGD